MARLQRVSPIGVPQHIIQRGNNKQICFVSADDMKAYLKWLTDFSKQYDVAVHAGVLMTNHIHLLCTPMADNAISKMMQSLGRMYVGYFNYTHGRSGTLWEGRYKSSLIQSEHYLLNVYRYIELNPVRAGMVNHPSEYSWSSYHYNALGLDNGLITPHQEYLLLGSNAEERQLNYQTLFQEGIDHKVLHDIQQSINKGLALGGSDFIDEMERLTNRRVSARKPGRPKRTITT